MSAGADRYLRLTVSEPGNPADNLADRRADLDAKQARMAAFLQEVECEGLLVLAPENFAWLTAGATARCVVNPAEMPGLYFTPEQRWLLCANVDTQWLFDEELDGLGFQLKEWPWHWGRAQFLADLCQGRSAACDRAYGACKGVGDRLARLRRALTPFEQVCLRSVGQVVSHALEAACRTMTPERTEREIAGQVSHRLLHRGVQPLAISVTADDRPRLYRHSEFSTAMIRRHCVLTATGSKYGLCATASRSVNFGPPTVDLRQEYDTSCKVTATYISLTTANAVPRELLSAGRRVYQVCGFEHEWLSCPQGHVTGRLPVELVMTPATEEPMQAGWAVTWQSTVGAASSCDTFLVTENGPELVTPTESWSQKRIRVQGTELLRPYLLVR